MENGVRPHFSSARKPLYRKALDEREDVALAVLEPGRPGAAVGDDAIRVLAGHVVVLELHAACLELAHLALDVVDLPERLARLRGAGVGRRVEEAGGALAELVRHPAGELASRLQTELLLVESAGPRHVTGRDIGV